MISKLFKIINNIYLVCIYTKIFIYIVHINIHSLFIFHHFPSFIEKSKTKVPHLYLLYIVMFESVYLATSKIIINGKKELKEKNGGFNVHWVRNG